MAQSDWLPAERRFEFDPDRFDFEWNEDYSMFRPHRLAWHDEASYLKYQAGQTCEDD